MPKLKINNKIINLDDFRNVDWVTTTAVCHKCRLTYDISYPLSMGTILCEKCGGEVETEYQKFFELINEGHQIFTDAIRILGQKSDQAYQANARMSEAYMWLVQGMNSRLTKGPPKSVEE